MFDNLDIKAGATVCQVGAGVGYYTAILAELVSPTGHVIAYEIEPDLAERAKNNLRHFPNVKVICGDATKAQNLPELDALTACAGVTNVPTRWLESLKEDGKLVLPYTGVDHYGFLLHLTKSAGKLPVKSLGPVSFYACAGARSDVEAQAISKAIETSARGVPDIAYYHFGNSSKSPENIWVMGQSYWISKL